MADKLAVAGFHELLHELHPLYDNFLENALFMLDLNQLSRLLEFLPYELFWVNVAFLNVVVVDRAVGLRRISDLSITFCDVQGSKRLEVASHTFFHSLLERELARMGS